MKLLNDLIYTDYGLMSLIVLVLTIGIAVYANHFFKQKMNESEQASKAK